MALVQAIVVAGALVAQRTGRAEEERVENVVPEAAIDAHEERAEAFTWLAAAGLATAGAVLVVPGGTSLTAAALVATVVSSVGASAAVWVGHSGGELVYRHGAASAYASAAYPSGEDGDDD